MAMKSRGFVMEHDSAANPRFCRIAREECMLKRVMVGLCALLLGLFVPGLLFAQTGTIAGKVVDAKSGDPLPGANVLVQGVDVGAATNVEGEFSIAGVPAGTRPVIARFIGYKSQIKTVTVTGGSVVELNFNLSETALQLDEVVVTGTGVAAEKKKLGNTVATVNATLIENAPVTNLSQMLQGREAGVNVLPSGGLVGEGARIRIRGSASLTQSIEPIVYVDGIRVDNAGGFAGTVYAGGGGVPSRLDDINPEAIERVEILKGAAAATLYGTQASSGIIQIFTKQGSFGKPKFTLEIEESTLNYPDAFKPNTGFARTQAQLDNMRQVFNDPSIQLFQPVQRTNVKDLFGTGLSQAYSLSVGGGGSGVTYFASARYQNTNGPFAPGPEDFLGEEPGPADDKLKRGQFSANLNIVPSNKLRIRLTSLYSNIQQQTLQNNNNIYGVISLAMFGKPELVKPNNPQGTAAFATVREVTYTETKDETDHAAVSISTSYKVNDEIALDGTFGLDYVSQRSSEFRPFGWDVDKFTGFNPDGLLDVGKREHKEWTIDVKGNWNRNFTPTISSAFVAGFQAFQTTSDVSGAISDLFPGPGLEVLDAGANQTAYSVFSEIINAGFFLQEQLGYRDYVYLTGGVRFDANSAFGSEFSTQAYPKVSVSFVPTTAFPKYSSYALSTLRLRAAIGQSGQQPGAFDQFTTYLPTTATEGASAPGLAPENLGDPTIKPEVSTEWELGFEAGLLNDRLGLQFTYWDRTIRDALIARQFPPSGGFQRTQLSNIGELYAKGIDLAANFSVIKKENFSLELFANGARLDEIIRSLGDAPEQKVSGTYDRIRNYLREGYAPGALFGAKLSNDPYPIDTNRDNKPETREQLLEYFKEPRNPTAFRAVLVDEDGDGDLLDHYSGKPTPDWQGAFGANIGFLKRFRLASLFEYKAGNFTVTNLTDAFRKSHPSIGRNIPEAAALEAILLNPASSAEQRLDAALKWEKKFRALAPFAGLNQQEKGDFIRVREISLTYDIPNNVTSWFGVNNASFTIAGRNLALISGYSGIDPEQNWYGRGGGGNETAGAQDRIDNNFLDSVEAFGLPLPREIVFRLRAGF
jgi:TonB-linked SusC/RagA family outer membrane protein